MPQISKNPKSFVGEHTIEYAVIPIIKNLLHKTYKYVTPIFPWMTREGSNISKIIHQNDQFQIFGIYPRRPKLITERDSIHFKINSQIVICAKEGIKHGIPIIAGCPIVNNLWELGNDPDFLWLRLDFDINDDLLFDLDDLKSLQSKVSNVRLNGKEIFSYLTSSTKRFSIKEAMDAFRAVNMKSREMDFYPRFGFGGIYKPMYFLYK